MAILPTLCRRISIKRGEIMANNPLVIQRKLLWLRDKADRKINPKDGRFVESLRKARYPTFQKWQLPRLGRLPDLGRHVRSPGPAPRTWRICASCEFVIAKEDGVG